jgi:hypothetical protein
MILRHLQSLIATPEQEEVIGHLKFIEHKRRKTLHIPLIPASIIAQKQVIKKLRIATLLKDGTQLRIRPQCARGHNNGALQFE